LLTIFKSIPLKLYGYLGLAIVIVGIMAKIYKAGGNKKEIEALNRTLDAVIRRKKIEANNSSLDNDAINERLRKSGWLRD
jgi:hypothetical protein